MRTLVNGFGLNQIDCIEVFQDWNQKCSPPWSEKEINHLYKNAERASYDKPAGHLADSDYKPRNPDCARPPRDKWAGIPKFSRKALEVFIKPAPFVKRDFFKKRSPRKVDGVTPGEFLEALYPVGARVLVFTEFYSQGDYLWQVGKGGFRLAKKEGVPAVPSVLPDDGGEKGIWFLNQPVSGKWLPNPSNKTKKTRRAAVNVTAWNHFVLESDDADEGDWLRLLLLIELPIVAIYSSGGRSIHALVSVEHEGEYDNYDRLNALLRKIKQILPRLGADPGALTAVRLTRLPGCTRNGRLQELIYLNPDALGNQRILDLPELR